MHTIIKKLSTIITSRVLYLILGIFLAAGFTAYATWDDARTGGSGELSEANWNELVTMIESEIKEDCPIGFVDTGYGYCIQSNENSARNWHTASDYCADTYNARICSQSEWYNACANGKANNMTGNWEWVDAWYSSGGAQPFIRGGSSCSVISFGVVTSLYSFHCCR